MLNPVENGEYYNDYLVVFDSSFTHCYYEKI